MCLKYNKKIMTNSWDFTNLSSLEVSSNSGKTRDPFLLEAKPANGINNEYEMDLRLLYYPQDGKMTRYQKNIVKITNPISDKDSIVIDCPRTVGSPSIFSDLFFLLKAKEKQKVDTQAVAAINKKFGRWTTFYSPVYVINDPIHPENNNQCKVLSYGFTINGLIDEEQKGSSINGKTNVFDYLTGKNFYYKVTKEGSFTKYDKSRFRDTSTPFTFLREDGKMHSVSIEELQAMAQGTDTPLKYLLMNKLPDMSVYAYKAPSDADLTTAAQYLRMILAPYQNILNELLNSTTDEVMKNKIIEASGMPQAQQAAPQQFVQQAAPQVSTQSWQPQQAPQAAPQWQPQAPQVASAPVQEAQQFVPQAAPQSWQPQAPQAAPQQTMSAPESSSDQQQAFDNLINNL